MIQFERIARDSDPLLRNLFEHYVHDMTEWFGGEVQSDGRFAYDTTHLWEDGCPIYLAKLDATIVGFAIVSSGEQWLGTPASRDVKEFFVLRAHRHAGIADVMARFIWNEFPAQWIVRVLLSNKPAVPFWRRTVRSYSGGAYEERLVTERERPWVHLVFDNSAQSGKV